MKYSSKTKTIKKCIFLGSVGTIGRTKITEEGSLIVKPLGRAKEIKVMHTKLINTHYIDIPNYDPVDSEETGEFIRFYLFDLKNTDKFCFSDNSPQEIVMKLNVLMEENKYLLAENEKLKFQLKEKGIDDFGIDGLNNASTQIRKLTNNVGMNSGMYQQNNGGK